MTEVTDDQAGTVTGYPGGYRKFEGDGCPGFDWTSQTTPNSALEQTHVFYLPIQPKISTTPVYVGILDATGATNSSPVMGTIGFALNGVAIYGNADATSADAYINEADTFDTVCGGHPAPNGGEYHFHSEVNQGCVYTDTTGQHSPLFGMMLDGIPIYGQYGDNGVAPTDLDECGGHVDSTHNFYHYHLPANKAFPYTVSCLKGCIYNGYSGLASYAKTTSTCSLQAAQYDYSSLAEDLSSITTVQTSSR